MDESLCSLQSQVLYPSLHSFLCIIQSRCIVKCVHVASGADRLTKACGLSLFPAITRVASVHTPTQSNNFLLYSRMKSSTILKSSFAVALLVIGLQERMSSLIVVPSTHHTYE
jgi:hypothetical protein